jgi:hypothetical protein
MNSLSWLIYLGDTVASLGMALGVCGSIVAGSAAFGFIPLTVEGDEAEWGVWAPRLRSLIIAGLCALFVGILIPSKQAFYMIAASEMAEKVVTTPEAKQMLGDLREVIAKQIKKLKDDK